MSKSDSEINFVVKYFALMIFAGFILSLLGCSSWEIQTPQTHNAEILAKAKAANPGYTIEVNYFSQYEISKQAGVNACGYITKVVSAKYCQINVAEHSTKAFKTLLYRGCLDDDFDGNLFKTICTSKRIGL